MTDKQIIVDGLSCDNCPESKRCQEQQTKKEYAINKVLQDMPSEYANVIDRLKQIIPSITRCDYVLEKQLKCKEQENEKIKESRDYYKRIVDGCPDVCENGFCQIDFYNKKLTKTLTEIKDIAEKHKATAHCDYLTDMDEILQKINEVIE